MTPSPCIVQSDLSVLLEVDHPDFEKAREGLSRFAELVKSPERIHTYRITPLSLWNAMAAGLSKEDILASLEALSRYSLGSNLKTDILEQAGRYGKLILERDPQDQALVLRSSDPMLSLRLGKSETIQSCFRGRRGDAFLVDDLERGRLKHRLIKLGYPVRDLAGYTPGHPFSFTLRQQDRSGQAFGLRPYQSHSVEAFLGPAMSAKEEGGNGVVALPCGAGKTVVGMAVMERLACHTLILAANITALRQWRKELLDKTDIPAQSIGEYSGEKKEIKPVTLATYQVVTYTSSDGSFIHFPLFNNEDWGLIIYDEVHMLPAPVFQFTASLQSRRRLGLTGTLIREDGKEDDVFSLIGPKRFDMPWKTLEAAGWVAQAQCFEIRIPMSDDLMLAYVTEPQDQKRFRIAAENPAKMDVIEALLQRHPEEKILIIGQYLNQLKLVAQRLEIPILTGSSSSSLREERYREFRQGRLGRLVVSSIANVALDLPEASCAIQISGRFGSRQEEAQRLGRILRPKKDSNIAYFYTIVSAATEEQSYARHRQLFLAEQGYQYTILPAQAILSPEPASQPLPEPAAA
ncbi:MAG: DEAD/DEAH box helicase [Elusimicrobia bacterium]|nr:DEAD/DEAH box helicase [Elusimicrobiota bacterium]